MSIVFHPPLETSSQHSIDSDDDQTKCADRQQHVGRCCGRPIRQPHPNAGNGQECNIGQRMPRDDPPPSRALGFGRRARCRSVICWRRLAVVGFFSCCNQRRPINTHTIAIETPLWILAGPHSPYLPQTKIYHQGIGRSHSCSSSFDWVCPVGSARRDRLDVIADGDRDLSRIRRDSRTLPRI